MKQLYIALLISIALAGNPAYAAVSINEVAWMGGIDSANHEWIEIYNNSDSSLVVDGWTLTDGVNLIINLVGTIGSNAYAVLERTSEESSPGTAFFIYTGALVNTGATLILTNSDGEIVDQITGGADWQNIGGDNTTKETAQYTASGWVTDEGTPGAVNGAGRVEEIALPEETITVGNTNIPTKSSKSSKNSSSASVILKNPETKMTLVTDVQNIGYVNQKIIFRVTAGGLSEADGKLVHYEWNFGDSYIATTSKSEHSYKYPGNYVVTVYAKNKKLEQVSRHEITILPVNFSLTFSEEGDLQINNDSAYDVDISGYLVRGSNSVILPPRSVISAFGTITLDTNRLNNSGNNSDIILYDAKRNLLTSTQEMDLDSSTEDLSSSQENLSFALVNEILPFVSNSDFDFNPKLAEASEISDFKVDANKREVIEIDNSTTSKNASEPRWPYLALFILLLVATFSIFVTKKSSDIERQ